MSATIDNSTFSSGPPDESPLYPLHATLVSYDMSPPSRVGAGPLGTYRKEAVLRDSGRADGDYAAAVSYARHGSERYEGAARKIARAARAPGAQVRPPPGWLPAPLRKSPAIGVS